MKPDDPGERPGPLTAADDFEIRQLIARYSWALDTKDSDEMGNVFTPDGVFRGASRVTEGREALRAFGHAPNPESREQQHFVTNIVLEGDSQRARARCYVVVIRPDSYYMGYYLDDLVKTDGRWAFRSRAFTRWPADRDRVAQHFAEAP